MQCAIVPRWLRVHSVSKKRHLLASTYGCGYRGCILAVAMVVVEHVGLVVLLVLALAVAVRLQDCY